MPDPVYRRRGERFEPTEVAAGPWSADAQHGGPVLGLLARAAEARADGTGLRLVRLTADLFRPVPMRPLAVRATPLREGRRLVALQLSVLAGEAEVTRAHALLLRPGDAPDGEAVEEAPPGPDGIDSVPLVPTDVPGQARVGFARRIEVRWAVRGGEPGTAVWMRLPLALVEGEETTALQHVAVLSDFANATATLARRDWDTRRVGFINADCGISLARPPAPGWLCMRLDRVADRGGVGTVDVSLFDREGPLGRVVQSRLANRPPLRGPAERR